MTQFEFSSRRGFLVRALAAVAGVAVGLPARGTLAARKTRSVYVLDPAGPDGCGSCAACRACRLHGENKLFASEDDADANRAHPNCDCAIRRAGALPHGIWQSLFNNQNKPGVADRRHQRTAILLGAFSAELS